tara:strand:- start:4087 stop:5043 length:957 start_codon:yes stop_codon:yes gene_type:complete
MKNKPKKNYKENSDNKFMKRSGRNNLSNVRNSSKEENFYDKYNSKKNNLKSSIQFKDKISFKNKTDYKEKDLQDYIWGKHSVIAALDSGRPVNRIWCTSENRSSEKFFLLLKEAKNKGVLVEEVSWSRISQLTKGAVHQGIALQLSYSQTISLEKLINQSKRNLHQVIVCLDGITDPHNVGAIIRSAEAFGCSGVIIPQRRSAGITGTVAKVAAGALEHIPICRVINLNRSLEELKKVGFLVVGLTEKANINLFNFEEKSPIVVVVGSESKGISIITQRYCDYLLKIPLKGKTSSLNASVAAAISLNHFSSNLHVSKG